jgi:hypothetical protein
MVACCVLVGDVAEIEVAPTLEVGLWIFLAK